MHISFFLKILFIHFTKHFFSLYFCMATFICLKILRPTFSRLYFILTCLFFAKFLFSKPDICNLLPAVQNSVVHDWLTLSLAFQVNFHGYF